MAKRHQTLICASHSLCTSNAFLQLVLKKPHLIRFILNILKKKWNPIHLKQTGLFSTSSMCFLKTSTLKLNPDNTNDLGPIASVVNKGKWEFYFILRQRHLLSLIFFSFKKGEQEE